MFNTTQRTIKCGKCQNWHKTTVRTRHGNKNITQRGMIAL